MRFPVLSVVATGIAVVATVGQYVAPGLIPALQRAPGGLPAGQQWRLVTPLLVQTLGWYQVAANLVTRVGSFSAPGELLRASLPLLRTSYSVHGVLLASWSSVMLRATAAMARAALERCAPPAWPAAGAVACYVAALTGWGLVVTERNGRWGW